VIFNIGVNNDKMAQQLVQLTVKSGPDKGRLFFLRPKTEALIGRIISADLRLTDPGVSQKHCVIRSAGDMVFVEDLKSRNGTKVNGERITTRVVDQNAEVQVGTSVLDLAWVKTERQAPLSAVPSGAAPTLLESGNASSTLAMASVQGGSDSTMTDLSQLQELRNAREFLGKMIGGFLLLESTGFSGLGTLFRAKGLKTKQEVALQLILRSNARSPERLTRFIRDTHLNLNIPHAANIVAAGEEEKYAYVAWENVRGQSLQTVARWRQRLAPDETVRLAGPLCEALAEAHRRKILHRDIMPANILLTEQTGPVLKGLGLAKKTDSDARSILTTVEDYTRYAYMAPELTREAPDADGRADVYALAATLYFALSGKPPFEADNHADLVKKVRYDVAPPLHELHKDVPEQLSSVIAQGMAREAASRFQDMPSFAAALKNGA
jgi:eukaryotic-like serine/threonine-protein kinase